MIANSSAEIEKLKKGGKILADTLIELKKYALDNYKSNNLTTFDLNTKCDEILKLNKVLPAFRYANPPFPTAACISINDEVVHGVPGKRILKEGDIVGIDVGVIYEKLFTDAAISFILGEGIKTDENLIKATRESLEAGIKQVVIGNKIGDIGNAIENIADSYGFRVVRDYCGHGVGRSVHESPSIPNYGKKGEGGIIKEGMVLAIEPMLVTGKEKVYVDGNGWTVKTVDGGNSAHWEHTVLVTKNGPVILTD